MTPNQNNFIELVTVVFAPGESRLFAISGQYFELIDAPNPVDVLLTDRNGAQRGIMRQAEASFNLKNTDFNTVQITSATAQTVRFAYGTGEGGTRRAAGSVTIATGAPLTDGQLRASAVPIVNRPPYNFDAAAALAAGAVQLLAPGGNVNGFHVVNLEAYGTAPAGGFGTFLAKAGAAPASLTDGDVLGISGFIVGGGTGLVRGKVENVVVPAGLGIYFYGQAGSAFGAGTSYACLIGQAL